MIADEVRSPEYIPHYLWKLLIDERYQRQGFGTATLDLIVEYFRGRPGVEVLSTCAGQGDGSPVAFYERYGFEHTGEEVRRRAAASAQAPLAERQRSCGGSAHHARRRPRQPRPEASSRRNALRWSGVGVPVAVP